VYVILTLISVITLAVAANLGLNYFLFSLVAVVLLYFSLLYFPQKYKLKYYSWFTVIVSLILFAYLFLILFFID
jgi:hypothetical protein